MMLLIHRLIRARSRYLKCIFIRTNELIPNIKINLIYFRVSQNFCLRIAQQKPFVLLQLTVTNFRTFRHLHCTTSSFSLIQSNLRSKKSERFSRSHSQEALLSNFVSYNKILLITKKNLEPIDFRKYPIFKSNGIFIGYCLISAKDTGYC